MGRGGCHQSGEKLRAPSLKAWGGGILNHLHRRWKHLPLVHYCVFGGHDVITPQGHHTASLHGLAFLPCLDVRAVGLGMSKAVSQIWRRKQAEEEKASEEKERRRRGWQGTNVTKPRRHGNQKGHPCPCPDTGGQGQGVAP